MGRETLAAGVKKSLLVCGAGRKVTDTSIVMCSSLIVRPGKLNMTTLRGSSSERDQFRGQGGKGLLLGGAAPGREGELSLPRGGGEAGL